MSEPDLESLLDYLFRDFHDDPPLPRLDWSPSLEDSTLCDFRPKLMDLCPPDDLCAPRPMELCKTTGSEAAAAPAPHEPMEIEGQGKPCFIDPVGILTGYLNRLGRRGVQSLLIGDGANLLIGFFEHLLREVDARGITSLDLGHVLGWYLDHLPPCVFICTKGRPLMRVPTWRALASRFGRTEQLPPDMAETISDMGYPVITVECLSVVSKGLLKRGETARGRADDALVILCAMLGDQDLLFGILTADKCRDAHLAPELELRLEFDDGTPPVTIFSRKTVMPPFHEWEWHPDRVRKAIERAARDYFF